MVLEAHINKKKYKLLGPVQKTKLIRIQTKTNLDPTKVLLDFKAWAKRFKIVTRRRN